MSGQAIDIQAALDGALNEARPLTSSGAPAAYIPALARVPREKLGLAVCFADGREVLAGDAEEPFSIQSVSKLFNLAFALGWVGEGLWARVGREPSGMRFNSLIQLEQEGGLPRNPFINPGAIVVVDALMAQRLQCLHAIRSELARMAGREAVEVDAEVAESERAHGDLNRAIGFFLRAHGNLSGDPIAVTDAYFDLCASAMSCLDLARAARFLIGAQAIGAQAGSIRYDTAQRRGIRALMRTCGLYDGAGDFAYRVGLPAKSGVGGGVLAVKPGRYAVCAWSPSLDAKGNSVAGVRALEVLAPALEAA